MLKLNIKTSSLVKRSPLPLLLLGLSQVLLFSATGCRTTSDNQIDLLERELRVQEDYIYELEDYVVEYSEKLRGCGACSPPQAASYSEDTYEPEPVPRRKKKTTRRETNKEESIVNTQEEPEVDIMPAPEEKAPLEELPPAEALPEEIDPEDMEVPDDIDIEIGDPLSSQENVQPLRQVASSESDGRYAGEQLLYIPDPVDYEAAEERDEESATRSDQRYADALFDDEQVETVSASVERVVKRLEVTQLFHGTGDQLSPKNLLTVVEALDDNGEPVDLDGEVSLMIMTAGESVTPKRLKRWNFTQAETLSAWQSSELGDGLHLELPLEMTELPEAPLELWVRLVMADGRKLLAQLPFENSQLINIADNVPKPLPARLTRVEPAEESNPAGMQLVVTESSVEEIAALDDEIVFEADMQDGQQAVGIAPASAADQALIAQKFEPKQKSDVSAKSIEDAAVKTVSGKQSQWRSASRSTKRVTKSFSTTAPKSVRWTTQAPRRQAGQRK